VSADQIAALVADFKRGNVRSPQRTITGRAYDPLLHRAEVDEIAAAPTIDATVMYAELEATNPEVDIYDGTLMRPVHESLNVCYVNGFGNVHLVHIGYAPAADMPNRQRWQPNDDSDTEHVTSHQIDWDAVEWIATITFWIGGDSSDGPLETCGPVYAMTAAVRADGTVEDFRWFKILDHDIDVFIMPTVVAIRCMTFLNCRNVIITEPARDRAQRRRLQRYGVTVNEVRIAPVGRWSRAPKGHTREVPDSVPLTTVRGHIARYGVDGRGLLFGRIAGTFWIPAHARGNPAVGTATHDYTITDN
jgi:hypothetical protein